MTISLKLKRCLICFLLLSWSFSSFATSGTDQYPDLEMHGLTYLNACPPAMRGNLRDTLLRKQVEDPDQAWQAIETILCAPDNESSRRGIASFIPEKVLVESEGTGQQPCSNMMPRDEVISYLLESGEAWDADIRVEPDEIALNYFPNEACSKSVKLTYANSRWSVKWVGEGCD